MDRRILIPWICLVLALGPLPNAGAQDSENAQLTSIETSPQASFEILTYEEANGRFPQTYVWIARDRIGSGRTLLFSGKGDTNVIVSPDERWIVVNLRTSESYGTFEVYRRTEGLEFTLVDGAADRRALAALMKIQNRSEPPRFARFICRMEAWSSDSGSLLGQLEGRLSGQRGFSRFYFVYIPESNEVTLDLGVLNRGAFGG